MLVDTGATDMTVTNNVAEQLLDSEQATLGPSGEVTLADGSIHASGNIYIKTVTIAGHELHNVIAGIVPDNADMLLGFSVLNQVSGRFVIDTTRSELTFE
jgi:clan AA aspartic protease (TIGR02281 family)